MRFTFALIYLAGLMTARSTAAEDGLSKTNLRRAAGNGAKQTIKTSHSKAIGTSEILRMLDNDLLGVAKSAIRLGLDPSLRVQVDSFEASDSHSDFEREELKRATMAAISLASGDQFRELIDPKNDAYSPTLEKWNDLGRTERSQICDTISSPDSMVASNIRECMCGSTEPFVRCQMMLGTAALGYHARRQRERKLLAEDEESGESMLQHYQQSGRKSVRAATCNISSQPPQLLGNNPNLKSLLKAVTEDAKGVSVRGTCGFDLPAPYNFLEIKGSVEVSNPDLPWVTREGALDAVSTGTLPSAEDVIALAESTKGTIKGELCLSITTELESAKLTVIKDILTFLGISLCFASVEYGIWPLREHGEFAVQKTHGPLYARASIRSQVGTQLRDTLELCKDVTPGCGNKDDFYCSMEQGENLGSFEIGVSFAIWSASESLRIGQSAYDDCDKWDDGTLCFLGTSCNNCKNAATYWYGKAFTACGEEGKWDDGVACGVGTTCNQCRNPPTWWTSKFFTACGVEPCWEDGTSCTAGVVCDTNCCNSWHWTGALGTCGEGECWEDGTVCLAGTTCDNNCCNSYSHWTGKGITACGEEPCWPKDTYCFPGTCGECCNSWELFFSGPYCT